MLHYQGLEPVNTFWQGKHFTARAKQVIRILAILTKSWPVHVLDVGTHLEVWLDGEGGQVHADAVLDAHVEKQEGGEHGHQELDPGCEFGLVCLICSSLLGLRLLQEGGRIALVVGGVDGGLAAARGQPLEAEVKKAEGDEECSEAWRGKEKK